MVRLLKLKELDERKRFLLAQSEMYRQSMTLEIANVKFSAALLKRQFRSKGAMAMLVGSAVPVGGLLFARNRAKHVVNALPMVLAGVRLLDRLLPWVKTFSHAKNGNSHHRNLPRHQ